MYRHARLWSESSDLSSELDTPPAAFSPALALRQQPSARSGMPLREMQLSAAQKEEAREHAIHLLSFLYVHLVNFDLVLLSCPGSLFWFLTSPSRVLPAFLFVLVSMSKFVWQVRIQNNCTKTVMVIGTYFVCLAIQHWKLKWFWPSAAHLGVAVPYVHMGVAIPER